MTERQRIYWRKYLTGYLPSEIARVFGVSRQAVSAALNRIPLRRYDRLMHAFSRINYKEDRDV